MALTTFEPTSTNRCNISGDGDVYGPGIRLCYYLQWLSVILTPYLTPSSSHKHPDPRQHKYKYTNPDLSSIRITTLILTISIYTTTLITLTKTALLIPEYHIIYSLTLLLPLGYLSLPIPTLLSKPSSHPTKTTTKIQISTPTLITQCLLWILITLIQPPLWFLLADHGSIPNCNIYVFLVFGGVSIYSRTWRTVFKIGSVLSAVACLFTILKGGLWVWGRVCSRIDFEDESEGEVEKGGEGKDEMREKEVEEMNQVLRWPLTAFQLATGILAIAQTEMTIRINGIDVPASLATTGQMIPLVTGVATLLATVGQGVWSWVLLVRKRGEKVKKMKNSSGGSEDSELSKVV
ncbi:hypothetical protein G7Y89_g5967 [Cudoniella acicularis]|uniref:Uncharacterized protein n=1 Tax=Cudoniella acicularis TaxID=354080 RepID=A0A8H4W581_9HELO|nr:hypothetical protein G7Y89_g5967 [Cudoniella acicularis]